MFIVIHRPQRSQYCGKYIYFIASVQSSYPLIRLFFFLLIVRTSRVGAIFSFNNNHKKLNHDRFCVHRKTKYKRLNQYRWCAKHNFSNNKFCRNVIMLCSTFCKKPKILRNSNKIFLRFHWLRRFFRFYFDVINILYLQ